MKKTILVFLFVFLFNIVFAGEIGDSCSYYVNQDKECDPANNIYCLEFTCEHVADPNEWCNDADSNNLAVSGNAESRYREYNGTWINLNNPDECLSRNALVSSCSGPECQIREATCIGTERVFETHECDNCDNGACLSWVNPIIGQPCNYSTNGDRECNTENNIYCVNGSCTEILYDTTIYCDDQDKNNLGTATISSSRYRNEFGDFYEQQEGDICWTDHWVENCSGKGCTIREITCNASGKLERNLHSCIECSQGACIKLNGSILGSSCDYVANGDSECDPENNIYCMGNVCVEFDGNTKNTCFDLGQNYFVKEYVDVKYRKSINGTIVEDRVYDACDGNNLFEMFCLENATPNYGPELIECKNGCSEGKCIQLNEAIEGTKCDFNALMDTECDPENSIYCMGNICTYSDENIESYCNDFDENQNIFIKGHLEFSFRASDGSIATGTAFDYCADENTLTQFKCIETETGINQIPEETKCDCIGGICIEGINIEIPKTVSDQELLAYISQWAGGKLTDNEIMLLIEVWKNN